MSNEPALPDEIEAAIEELSRAAMAVGYASTRQPNYSAARNAELAHNNIRRVIRAALAAAPTTTPGWKLPPMIWLQMDEGEPWHLFGDLDTTAACGAAITTSRPHVEERMTPEHACPACVDHAKERGLRMT